MPREVELNQYNQTSILRETVKIFSLSGSQNLERIADIYKEYRGCVGI